MVAISTEILDERLLRIHELWKNPPRQWVSTSDGYRATELSCFKVPPLPLYHKRRFRDEYGLSEDDIDWWFNTETVEENDEKIIFLCDTMFDMIFERSLDIRMYPQMTSKIIVQLFSSRFTSRWAMFIFFSELDLEDFGNFVRECVQYEYPWKYIQDTIHAYFECPERVLFKKLTLDCPYTIMDNQNELETLCDKVIAENPKSLEDYRKGKTNSINHLKGQAMKLSKGKADIRLVTEILERKLKA